MTIKVIAVVILSTVLTCSSGAPTFGMGMQTFPPCGYMGIMGFPLYVGMGYPMTGCGGGGFGGYPMGGGMGMGMGGYYPGMGMGMGMGYPMYGGYYPGMGGGFGTSTSQASASSMGGMGMSGSNAQASSSSMGGGGMYG